MENLVERVLNRFKSRLDDSNKILIQRSLGYSAWCHCEFYPYYTAYLVIVGSTTTQVKYASTPWTSTSGLSVKYCDSIAKDEFTGTNITGKTYNQRFDNVQVSNNDGASYTSFSSYSTYKEWKKAPNGNYKWYGTIDCLPNYIHNSSGSVSIYQ